MAFGSIISATSSIISIIKNLRDLLSGNKGQASGMSLEEVQDEQLLAKIIAYLPEDFMSALGSQYTADYFPTSMFDVLNEFEYTLMESPTAYFHDYELAEDFRELKAAVSDFLAFLEDSDTIPGTMFHSMFRMTLAGQVDREYYNARMDEYAEIDNAFHELRMNVYERYWTLLYHAHEKCLAWESNAC